VPADVTVTASPLPDGVLHVWSPADRVVVVTAQVSEGEVYASIERRRQYRCA
jgi:hypothetical protein